MNTWKKLRFNASESHSVTNNTLIMSLIVTTLLLILILSLLYYVVSKWWNERNIFFNKIKNIPGPKQYPFLGNSLDIKKCQDILPKFLEYQTKYGSTFKLKLGLSHYLISSDPSMIEAIVSSTEQVSKQAEIYKYLRNWIGDGLICAENPKWQQHRHLIVPTFHIRVLKNYVPIFYKNAINLVQHWKQLLCNSSQDSYEFDICEDVNACTLDTICETTMGVTINFLKENKQSKYLKGIQFMGQTMVERCFSLWKGFDILYKFSSSYRQEMELLSVVKNTTNDIIEQRKQHYAKNATKTNENIEDKTKPKRKGFLDYLLELTKEDGGLFSDKELRDEAHTILFAGSESTSLCTSFTLYLLAKHPEIQSKVLNETIDVFGDCDIKNEDITYENLTKLKYLDMVIKESLRLYPIAIMFCRKLTKDVVYNGLLLPKDLNVVAFVYGAHVNSAIYPNPYEFNPERFSPANITSRNSYAYIPFSGGIRNCVGQKFVFLEIKCLIACLLREFKFSADQNFVVQPTTEGSLKSANGVRLIMQQRF